MRVVVVNEHFAKDHFGGEMPLGRRITLGGPHPRDMEIVGVCASAHYGRLKDDIRPVIYIPYNQGDHPQVQQMVYERTVIAPIWQLGFINGVGPRVGTILITGTVSGLRGFPVQQQP